MIKNKSLIAIALCVSLFSHTSFAAEQPSGWLNWGTVGLRGAKDWAYNKGSAIWQTGTQGLSQATSYVASIPQSLINTISTWSTQKKIAVFIAIIGALALIYNKDAVMQMVSDAYNKTSFEQKGLFGMGSAGLAAVTAAAKNANDLYHSTLQQEKNALDNNPNLSIEKKIEIVKKDLNLVDNFYGTTPELSRPLRDSPARYQAQRSALLTVLKELSNEKDKKISEMHEKRMLLESLIPKEKEG